MDLLSFVLGMSIVVVIAVAIVAVISFVKVNKHNKEIEDIHQVIGRELEIVNQVISRELENQTRERDQIVQDIYRTLDSRLDKLESRLTAQKA